MNEASTPRARINLEKAAVLIVESNHQGMEILSQILAGLGVRSRFKCENTEAALVALKTMDLDLIICDSVLSDASGYDFISQLRRSQLEPNRFAPVVMVSGHTPKSDVHKARDCGANFVIAKPLTAQTLLERILWIAREPRAFMETPNFVGPDRRFHNLGPPADMGGRRKDDLDPEEDAGAEAPSSAEAR